MHAIKWSKTELKALAENIEHAASRRTDLETILGSDYHLATSAMRDPDSVQYHGIQDDPVKWRIERYLGQHAMQVLYHMPLKKLPREVNHANYIVRCIVMWRMRVGR